MFQPGLAVSTGCVYFTFVESRSPEVNIATPAKETLFVLFLAVGLRLNLGTER